MDRNQLPTTEKDFNVFFSQERRKIIAFLCGKYNLSKEEAEDIYQDSCLALFLNIKKGKLVSLTSSLSTYFAKICIFQTLKKKRDIIPTVNLDDIHYNPSKLEFLLEEQNFSVKQQEIMEYIVTHLPEPCDKILWSYYYDNRCMSDIAKIVGFKNADSVKAKKSQCIRKLRNRFTNSLNDIMYGGKD